MGFPSPAADYAANKIIPNDACQWLGKPSQYMMRAAETSWHKKRRHAYLDASRKPCEDSIVVATICGEFVLRRMHFHPTLCLASLDQPEEVTLIGGGDWEEEETQIFAVVTHVINDTTSEEFDDSPYM